jgi:hypothetical protein
MCDYDKSALAYNSPLDLSARLLLGSTERLVKADMKLKRLTMLVAGYKSINKKLLVEIDNLNQHIEMQRIAIADMHKWYRSTSTYVSRPNRLDETPTDDV